MTGYREVGITGQSFNGGAVGAPDSGACSAMPMRPGRRSRWPVVPLAIGLSIAGCASYEPKPLQPERSAQAFAARRLDAPEVRERIDAVLPGVAAAWPPPVWDRASLLAIALVCNEKLTVARAQLQAARTHEQAIHPANPDLTLQSEYARHDPHPWLYGFALELTLRSPEIKRLQNELARIGTSDARWQLLDQVWAVRRSLVAALSDQVVARQRSALLGRLAASQDRLIAIEEQRVAAGEDAPAELFTARQSRIETTQQQAQARAALAAAQSALAASLGVPATALDGIDLSWPEWGEPPATDEALAREAREQALLSRSDLAALIGDYAQAENNLQQAVARQYPQWRLAPGYYWDHGVAKFPFDAGLSLPQFNRGEIAEARAERDVAGARVVARQAEIFADVDAAGRAERSARDSQHAALQSVQAARDQERRAQVGLRLGALGREETVGAEVLTLRGELELIDARAQLQAARNSLEDALHAPLSGPEIALARSLPGMVAEASR